MTIPNSAMYDVRIVHDRVGSYADWHKLIGIQYNAYETEQYLLGKVLPNYPVPATMDNAVIALYHQKEITVWSVEWFKRELRKAI